MEFLQTEGSWGGVRRGSSVYHIYKTAYYEVLHAGILMDLVDPQRFYVNTQNKAVALTLENLVGMVP